MQQSTRTRFLHERLDAYHVAQELVAVTVDITRTLPRGFAELRDQARRAALAIVRHIAEGASRLTPADKRQRFVIALGEAAELDATLESAARVEAIARADVARARVLSTRAGAMLAGLIKRLGGGP